MDKTTLLSIALLVVAAFFEFSIREIPIAPGAVTAQPAEQRVTIESSQDTPAKPTIQSDQARPTSTPTRDNLGCLNHESDLSQAGC